MFKLYIINITLNNIIVEEKNYNLFIHGEINKLLYILLDFII